MNIDSILLQFEQVVDFNTAHTGKENKSRKDAQDSNSKKCVQTITKSFISTTSDRTMDSTVKHNIKKVNTKSNISSLCQKMSTKSPSKARKQSENGNVDTARKKVIINKVEKNKNKVKLLNENDARTSPSTLHDQEEDKESVKKLQISLKSKKYKNTFPEMISVAKIKLILESQDPVNFKYVKGYLCINPRYFKNAYVRMPNEENDLLIIGVRDRNRALDGDLVVAIINEEEKWQKDNNGQIQKTGTVVSIIEQIHPRKGVGHLKQINKLVLLQPRDIRIPFIKIYPESLPAMYDTTSSLFNEVLFVANITKWNKPWFPVGKIEHTLGTVGDIEVELNAILLQNDIKTQPFNEKLVKELPFDKNIFTKAEIKSREDWRNHCVFTIDPATAVDLDDAVSCRLMENGNYEVGVHISDVTHYLKPCTALDKQVAKRATTVYLTNHVYFMLPQKLGNLCSLLPGEDKLTFSVIWEMTPEAEIVKHRFTKSIINSCCQMSYEQAQMIIENPECFPDDTLKIKGSFTSLDVCKVVENLFKLSKKMRTRRFMDGALRINRPKLRIVIDKKSGLPVSYDISEEKDSNRLIEEFMLQANMTVATHLYKTIPEYALLRNHSMPSTRVLTQTQNILQKFGIHLDIGSAGDLYASIRRYETYSELQSVEYMYLTKYRLMVINHLCTKAMARATYQCSSKVETVEDLRHYALNVPFYTHFTSPIRRYIDCIVHRLLHSTLSAKAALPLDWSPEACYKIAQNCNVRKHYAKVAEEQSNELYFTYLIQIKGPTTIVAIVFEVKERYIGVLSCDTGIKLKVYLADIEDEATVKYDNEFPVSTLTVTWKASNFIQVITVFTIVHIRIEKHADLFRLNATLLEPSQDHELGV